MEIYVAILCDSHIDDCIKLFPNLEKAMKQIGEWQSGYNRKKWIEEELDGWEYYVSTESDEGPSMRIERKLLEV